MQDQTSQPQAYGQSEDLSAQLPPLSFGEKLVGIQFNPSNDGDVNIIKTKFAELVNLLRDKAGQQETSEIGIRVYDGVIEKLLDAQMWAVKFVTLKY